MPIRPIGPIRPIDPINQKSPSLLELLSWKLLGSNQRPPACKAGALNQLS